MIRAGQMRGLRVCLLPVLLSSCTPFYYEPQLLSRGEMTVRANWRGVELRAGGQRIASSLGLYDGLTDYVGCVPRARTYAERARFTSIAAAVFSGGAVLFGLLGFGYLIRDAATYDQPSLSDCKPGDQGTEQCTVRYTNQPLSGRSFTLSLIGSVLAGLSVSLRYRATGQAVDAMNYYNDAVGSLGATCANLRYPSSVALTPHASSAISPPESAPATAGTPPASTRTDPAKPTTRPPPVRRPPGIYIQKLAPSRP